MRYFMLLPTHNAIPTPQKLRSICTAAALFALESPAPVLVLGEHPVLQAGEVLRILITSTARQRDRSILFLYYFNASPL